MPLPCPARFTYDAPCDPAVGRLAVGGVRVFHTMAQGMEFLQRIRQIACRLDQQGFVRGHGGLYLLGSLPRPNETNRDAWSFATNPRIIPEEILRNAGRIDEARLLAGRFLVRIEKSDRNPFARHISLGRAPNNDLVIRHPSVSKLHAHFLLDARPVPPEVITQSVGVRDVGSRNGTTLNGEPLRPDEERAAAVGDYLSFGEVECDLLDAGMLHERIRMVLPTNDLASRPTGR